MEQKVYVIGIGPGAYEEMTIRAVKALKECDVIIGYTVYVDLVKEHFPGKRFLTTPMTWEVKRCEMALREAEAGQVTAMICSGDAGVYGMAGLMYEMREHMELGGVKITVIPGITAATAGAARLGAPLIHDFAVISLSDLLTPWEQIEERLRDAAKETLPSVFTIHPAESVRIICAVHVILCWNIEARIRYAAMCVRSQGKEKNSI